MTTHRNLDGSWGECAQPEACNLLFHFPDMTVMELEAIPLLPLLALLEVFDPPQRLWLGAKFWYRHGEVHRDYDLPAQIEPDGTLRWYTRDKPHRDGDKPAVIHRDGRLEWWTAGEQDFTQRPGQPRRPRRPRAVERLVRRLG